MLLAFHMMLALKYNTLKKWYILQHLFVWPVFFILTLFFPFKNVCQPGGTYFLILQFFVSPIAGQPGRGTPALGDSLVGQREQASSLRAVQVALLAV